MDIVSKRAGPRREDAEARRLIEQNRGTIERLADQLSNGAYSAGKRAQETQPPQPSGVITSDLGAPRRNDDPKPYVRISPNRRVVVVDDGTSRQMHHLGELRRVDGRLAFVLATRGNGFFSELAPEIAARLAPLDGAPLGDGRSEASLAGEIGALLGY